eukprot:tig00000147_g9454.t1
MLGTVWNQIRSAASAWEATFDAGKPPASPSQAAQEEGYSLLPENTCVVDSPQILFDELPLPGDPEALLNSLLLEGDAPPPLQAASADGSARSSFDSVASSSASHVSSHEDGLASSALIQQLLVPAEELVNELHPAAATAVAAAGASGGPTPTAPRSPQLQPQQPPKQAPAPGAVPVVLPGATPFAVPRAAPVAPGAPGDARPRHPTPAFPAHAASAGPASAPAPPVPLLFPPPPPPATFVHGFALDPERARKEQRLMKNREAAAVSRQRKRAHQEELQEEVAALRAECAAEHERCAVLEAENRMLKGQVSFLQGLLAQVHGRPGGAPGAPGAFAGGPASLEAPGIPVSVPPEAGGNVSRTATLLLVVFCCAVYFHPSHVGPGGIYGVPPLPFERAGGPAAFLEASAQGAGRVLLSAPASDGAAGLSPAEPPPPPPPLVPPPLPSPSLGELEGAWAARSGCALLLVAGALLWLSARRLLKGALLRVWMGVYVLKCRTLALTFFGRRAAALPQWGKAQ